MKPRNWMLGFLALSGIASAQPKFTAMYTVTVKPAPLTYVERVRSADRPPPRAGSGVRETHGGLAGAMAGISLSIEGYQPVGSYPVKVDGITVTHRVYARDGGAAKKVADSEFDGACTTSLTISGNAEMSITGIVKLTPTATPRLPKCTPAGVAANMPDFRTAFNTRVANEVVRVLKELQQDIPLGDKLKELELKDTRPKTSQTAKTEQVRKFTFLGEPNELRIEIVASYKFEGALGIVP